MDCVGLCSDRSHQKGERASRHEPGAVSFVRAGDNAEIAEQEQHEPSPRSSAHTAHSRKVTPMESKEFDPKKIDGLTSSVKSN